MRGPSSELGSNGARDRTSERGSRRPSVEHTDLPKVAASFGVPLEPAQRLLQIMGRRGGWSDDALIEASGLSASQVAVNLTLLEVAGRVRRRDFYLEPV